MVNTGRVQTSPTRASKIETLLRLNWKPQAIAVAPGIGCSLRTVQRIQHSLLRYEQRYPPPLHTKGATPSLTKHQEDTIIAWLSREPYTQQSELVLFVKEEFDLDVSRFTISRLLQRREWSRATAYRLSDRQDPRLVRNWQALMCHYTAEQLLFVDESSFNRQTGWRPYAYAPIGEDARYQASRDRGRSYSVLPAYTTEGYMCCDIKEGYYSREDFLQFLVNDVFPRMSRFPGPKSLLIMDNASIHVAEVVNSFCQQFGVEIAYLPPYSPQYNPIELTFSVLKSWIRRNFRRLFRAFEGDFEAFLRFAIRHSRCDHHARKHFTLPMVAIYMRRI